MAAASGVLSTSSIQWTKSLKILPKFSSDHINIHLKGCGKKTVGQKGYKFFVENYIHDVFVGEKTNIDNVFVKGRCFRSQRKNEEPHFLNLEVKSTGEIVLTQCSCKAGAGGHCNHMFALLYLLIHWAMLGVTDIAADKTCTSLPQQWHKPRTQTIEADPIMKCVFAQASKDKDGGRKRKPVHCKLYNAAKKVRLSNNEIMSTCASMSQEQKVPPFSYLLSDQENAQHINTVIGNVPLGGYLGYQLQDEKKKKSVFSVTKRQGGIITRHAAKQG
ncbi:hypothetical protein QZH41_018253 [Actinostola sp. cb2023]|nr:hypothetical protein QZH41_018253 [Actinostola sp. cb2023]